MFDNTKSCISVLFFRIAALAAVAPQAAAQHGWRSCCGWSPQACCVEQKFLGLHISDLNYTNIFCPNQCCALLSLDISKVLFSIVQNFIFSSISLL